MRTSEPFFQSQDGTTKVLLPPRAGRTALVFSPPGFDLTGATDNRYAIFFGSPGAGTGGIIIRQNCSVVILDGSLIGDAMQGIVNVVGVPGVNVAGFEVYEK